MDLSWQGSNHRVGRVLSVSPVVGIGTPPPLQPQASVPPQPLVRGGGHTRMRLKGWGSPNSNEGTDIVVLYIYKYFVVPMLWIGIVLMPIRIRTLLSMVMLIRIRIGMKTMPIHMRILPKVLHMMENRANYFYFYSRQWALGNASLQCFSFHISGKCVMILSILNSIQKPIQIWIRQFYADPIPIFILIHITGTVLPVFSRAIHTDTGMLFVIL